MLNVRTVLGDTESGFTQEWAENREERAVCRAQLVDHNQAPPARPVVEHPPHASPPFDLDDEQRTYGKISCSNVFYLRILVSSTFKNYLTDFRSYLCKILNHKIH